MNSTKNDSPIIGKVCKHANYTVNRFDPMKDCVAAKITNIHEDGSRSNSFICIEDYKQDFYIVKEKYRKFKQRKDYIDERMCKKFRSSRARLPYNISKTLHGRPDITAELRQMKGNQFVFGCEQTIPVILKHKFFEHYQEHQIKERYTMAAYDVETNMFSQEQEVIMASVTFKERAYFAAVRGWFDEKTDEEIFKKLKEHEEQYLGSILKERNCTVIYELFDTEAEVVEANIMKFHEWEPDWVTSWNSEFDMRKNEEALLRRGKDLAQVYSDPKIPREYQYYVFDKGRTHKIKENGDTQQLQWHQKFPTIRTMAKWQWADAGAFYAIKRTAMGKLDKYSLQHVSELEGVPGKLYTEEGSDYRSGTPDWHINMQRNHKYIYCMYNINDNFVIEDINDKTEDFSLSLPMLLKSSEYFNYPSQPRCISDELSFIAKEHGYVWGCTGQKKGDWVEKLPTLGDWIALLETEKNAEKGKVLFEGLADVISLARGLTDDIDVTGAYPTATVALNVSNKTTRMEVWKIQGADDMKFREIAVNYASGVEANAMSLGYDLFRFPKIKDLQTVFETHMKKIGKEDVLDRLKN